MSGVVYSSMETDTVSMDSDLSDKEYYAVNKDASGNGVAIAADASKPPYLLVEGYDGSSTERIGTIARSGKGKVKLGGTVSRGDKLTSDSNGKWVATTTDTDHYGAIADADGVVNDVIPADIERGMVAG